MLHRRCPDGRRSTPTPRKVIHSAAEGTAYDAGMAVLIDPPRWPAHGRVWSHLVSDVSLTELHTFAEAHGIPRRGFEGDHYDVPESMYAALVAAGARPVSGRDLLRSLQRTGMRLRKRRGERGLARVSGVAFPDGTTADIEIVASGREFPQARVFAAMVFVRDVAGDVALVHSIRRQEWGSPGGWREPGESVRENAIREVEEETGLKVRAGDLEPVGYERFTPRVSGGLWQPGREVLQAFGAEVAEVRPALRSDFDDTSGREWVTPAEFERRCGAQFWWPLAAHAVTR